MSNILDQRGCDGVMGVMAPHSRRGVGQQILHGQDVARVQCTPPNPPRVTPPPSHPHPFFILSQHAPFRSRFATMLHYLTCGQRAWVARCGLYIGCWQGLWNQGLIPKHQMDTPTVGYRLVQNRYRHSNKRHVTGCACRNKPSLLHPPVVQVHQDYDSRDGYVHRVRI